MGLIAAGCGGELFVRGTVKLAYWARISPGIVATTIAAFATSSPELTVSITASMLSRPQIALGDALGSNVVNIALILGIAISVARIHCPKDCVKRDFPVALLVPSITGLLLLDGKLSRSDGVLLLSFFIIWLIAVTFEIKKQRKESKEAVKQREGIIAAIQSVSGLLLLIIAGRLIIYGATGVMQSLGLDAFIIGATVIAFGTSAPELATIIIAKLKHHDDIALGTVLGSNIFNGLLITSVAAIISPISIIWSEIMATLFIGILSVVSLFPSSNGYIERRRGYLLLVLYVIYLIVITQSQGVNGPQQLRL